MSEEASGGRAATRRTTLPLNEIKAAGERAKGAADRALADSVAGHYQKDGNAFRSAHIPDKVEFVDRVNRMHAYRPVSAFTIRTLVETAQRRGWQALSMTGDKAFRSHVYVEAASRGMAVKGYTPTEKDADLVKNRADRAAARGNPLVQEFVNAADAKAVKAAIKQHPELKDAFATMVAVATMAESIDSKKGAENFVGMMRDRIALALHRGEKMPEVKVREDRGKEQAPAKNTDLSR